MYEKLKTEMEQQNVSVYRIAKDTGIHATDLYSALGCKKPMYPKWRKILADYLGVPEEDLFEEGKERANA